MLLQQLQKERMDYELKLNEAEATLAWSDKTPLSCTVWCVLCDGQTL